MLRLLLEHGAYPSEEICAVGYHYNHTRSTPLQRAVQTGSLDDVRELLSKGAHDVNWHPKFCIRRSAYSSLFGEKSPCVHCDTPLMTAVRREDFAMMRLLIAHGANVSEEVNGEYGIGPRWTRKTALLLALHTENEEIIRELVNAGADVNQSLGPVGTALHLCCHSDQNIQILTELGADPNLVDDLGTPAVVLVLFRSYLSDDSKLPSALEMLRALLPSTRDLDNIVKGNLLSSLK